MDETSEGVGDRRGDQDLTRPFLQELPISGTAVSTIGDLLGTETLSASDPVAARLDEMQFDLGEGPCWDALRLRRPILQPDMRTVDGVLWPVFTQAVIAEGIGALFAFPMLVGPLQVGAVDMYAHHPLILSKVQTKRAVELADATARQVLQRALRSVIADSGDGYVEDDNPFSRKIVHQATGMVLAQLNINVDDARMVIQAHAFANNRSMMDVAQDILDRRIDLSNPEAGTGNLS